MVTLKRVQTKIKGDSRFSVVLRRSQCVLVALAVFLLLGGCSATKSFLTSASEGKAKIGRSASYLRTASAKLIPGKGREYPPVPFDKDGPRVRRFLREYTQRQRGTIERYMERAERFMPMVKATARDHGLPEDVAYLFMLESGANPSARSPANALGMWQFMPATARSYGLRVDSWVDERLDPRKSTRAAMLYLKDLYGMFGCWRLALSAYNSGENKLNRVLCQEDADEYDQICSSPKLKRETREFWPRFQAIAQIASKPGKHGFSRMRKKHYKEPHSTMMVKGAYSFETIAAAAESSQEAIRRLNPDLIRGMTPPDGQPHPLRVPASKRNLLAERLPRISPDRPLGHTVHVVNRGDNLRKILKRYRISKARLATLNPDVNLRKGLRRGEKLVVPMKSSSARRSRRPERLSWLR